MSTSRGLVVSAGVIVYPTKASPKLMTPMWEKIAMTKTKTTIIGIFFKIFHVLIMAGTKFFLILFPQTKLTKKTKKTKLTLKTKTKTKT